MSIEVSETTWLENIKEMKISEMPGGKGKLVSYTLGNGHRYVIPLVGDVLRGTQRGLSPLTVVGAGNLPPTNGQG